MIERITEKEMMQRINHVKEQLILTQGEGDMRFQDFRKWVRNQISEWYDNNEDYKKEIEEAVERLHERFGAEEYEGHTPGPWETNSEDSQGVWQEHDESIPRTIAMVHPTQYWEDMSEAEFMRMMADKELIADAPKLLAKSRVLDKIIAWHERNQLQGESIQYELDRINWMLENPDKDYDEYPYTYDGGFREGFDAETFEAERYKPTPKEIRMFVKYLRVFWLRYEEGIYDQDEVLEKIEWALYHTGVLQEDEADYEFAAESERTFTVSKGPKRMYIVVEYNDGKELFLDGDGQKYFMEELAEAEATGDEILVEKLFGVGSDYHGIAEEVVEAEDFEAQGYNEIEVEKYVDIDWETDPHPHPYDDDINKRQIFDEVSGYVEDAVERGRDSGFGDIEVEIEVEDEEENEVVEKTVRVEYDYQLQGESFEATKNCVWCGSTENICCTNEASQNSVRGIKNRFGEEVIESFPMSNPTEEEYVCDECCFICGDKSVLIPNLIESSEMGHPESFEATKGIDTYSQPFEELRIKPSKAKVGILLASIVASGVWFVNKMKED